MSKIIILKWLPASGKSTWAKEQVEKSGKNIVRVNKDDIRAMVGGYSKPNEKLTIEIRDIVIAKSITDGRNVIVDDTNLNPIHEEDIRWIASELWAIVEIKEFRTSVEECIERDSKRENPVWEKVIREMNEKWKWITPIQEFTPVTQNPKLPKAIICDIDWTLAHMNWRSPYDYSKVSEDIEDIPVKEILKAMFKQWYNIIFVSWRPDSCREDTENWIKQTFKSSRIPIDSALLMRKEWDRRNDSIVKREILEEIIKSRYVMFSLDDRDRVVNMWRESGIKCLQVQEGNF